jgi:hypothetical protein
VTTADRPDLGRRFPDLVLVMDRTEQRDKSLSKKTYIEFRVQCEVEIDDVNEAREIFEALYGSDRSKGGVTKAHEIIKRRLEKQNPRPLFRTIVDLAFIDNGSDAKVADQVLEELRSISS